jgi:hypothetical protein
MTSSGNYFYRYGETYYNLPSAQLELDHSYDSQAMLNTNTTSVKQKNAVFDIVATGEPMFSPYTSWKLKVKGIQFTDPIFQADVKNCLSNLELKFYGNAVYIDKSSFEAQASVRVPVHECYKSFETKVFNILPKA